MTNISSSFKRGNHPTPMADETEKTQTTHPPPLSLTSQQKDMFAIGCEDGRLLFCTASKNRSKKLLYKERGKVEDLQWDPNSSSYLLVCWELGDMAMLDCSQGKYTEIVKFDNQTSDFHTLAWIKNIPGGFLTSNQNIAALKVWNVASKKPVSTVKVGKTGILNMIPLDHTNITFNGFLLTFNNGSVGILNLDQKKLTYLSDSNHNETIFDIGFSPADKNTFATCSYDGSIRLWDAQSMTIRSILEDKVSRRFYNKDYCEDLDQKTIVNCLSWCKQHPELLATSNNHSEVCIWDTKCSRLITRFTVQKQKKNIFDVKWNELDPRFLVCSHEQ